MSLWKRAMDYLGLGPEDPYDDYDAPEPEPVRASRPSRAQAPQDTEPQRSRPRPVAVEDPGQWRPVWDLRRCRGGLRGHVALDPVGAMKLRDSC